MFLFAKDRTLNISPRIASGSVVEPANDTMMLIDMIYVGTLTEYLFCMSSITLGIVIVLLNFSVYASDMIHTSAHTRYTNNTDCFGFTVAMVISH